MLGGEGWWVGSPLGTRHHLPCPPSNPVADGSAEVEGAVRATAGDTGLLTPQGSHLKPSPKPAHSAHTVPSDNGEVGRWRFVILALL